MAGHTGHTGHYPNVHKTSPTYVRTPSDKAEFLAHLSRRQIAVGAGYLDGLTQSQLAEQNGIDQATVSRDLQIVRRAAARIGKSLPTPLRVRARDECQLSDRLYAAL